MPRLGYPIRRPSPVWHGESSDKIQTTAGPVKKWSRSSSMRIDIRWLPNVTLPCTLVWSSRAGSNGGILIRLLLNNPPETEIGRHGKVVPFPSRFPRSALLLCHAINLFSRRVIRLYRGAGKPMNRRDSQIMENGAQWSFPPSGAPFLEGKKKKKKKGKKKRKQIGYNCRHGDGSSPSSDQCVKKTECAYRLTARLTAHRATFDAYYLHADRRGKKKRKKKSPTLVPRWL